MLLDECCNKSCHPTWFAIIAEAVYRRQNRRIGELTSPKRNFRGLGNTTSTRNRNLAIGIEFEPKNGRIAYMEGVILSDGMDSDEMVGGLMSVAAQSALDIVKDVSLGTLYMKRFGRNVKMYQCAHDGLRCIKVSSFAPRNC